MKLTLEESGWFNVMSHCWRLRQYGLFHTHRGLIAHTRAHGTHAFLGLTASKQSLGCRDWDQKHSLFQRGHQELHRPFEMDLHCHRSSSSSATSHHLVPGSHCAARRTGESSSARERQPTQAKRGKEVAKERVSCMAPQTTSRARATESVPGHEGSHKCSGSSF